MVHKRKVAEKFWSVYDLQTNRYMATGMNSSSLKGAVEDLWEFYIEGSGLEQKDVDKMNRWGWTKKKKWLEGSEFRFDKHTGKQEENW